MKVSRIESFSNRSLLSCQNFCCSFELSTLAFVLLIWANCSNSLINFPSNLNIPVDILSTFVLNLRRCVQCVQYNTTFIERTRCFSSHNLEHSHCELFSSLALSLWPYRAVFTFKRVSIWNMPCFRRSPHLLNSQAALLLIVAEPTRSFACSSHIFQPR